MVYVKSFGRRARDILTIEEVKREITNEINKLIGMFSDYATKKSLEDLVKKVDGIGIKPIFRKIRGENHPDSNEVLAHVFATRIIGNLYRINGEIKLIRGVLKGYKLCDIPTDIAGRTPSNYDLHFPIWDEAHELTTFNLRKDGNNLSIYILDELNPGLEFKFDFFTIV